MIRRRRTSSFHHFPDPNTELRNFVASFQSSFTPTPPEEACPSPDLASPCGPGVDTTEIATPTATYLLCNEGFGDVSANGVVVRGFMKTDEHSLHRVVFKFAARGLSAEIDAAIALHSKFPDMFMKYIGEFHIQPRHAHITIPLWGGESLPLGSLLNRPVGVFEMIGCDSSTSLEIHMQFSQLLYLEEDVIAEMSCFAVQKTLAFLATVATGYYNSDMHDGNYLIDKTRKFTFEGMSCLAIKAIDPGNAFRISGHSMSLCKYGRKETSSVLGVAKNAVLAAFRRWKFEYFEKMRKRGRTASADDVVRLVNEGLFREYFSPMYSFAVGEHFMEPDERLVNFLKRLTEEMRWIDKTKVRELGKCSKRFDNYTFPLYDKLGEFLTEKLVNNNEC